MEWELTKEEIADTKDKALKQFYDLISEGGVFDSSAFVRISHKAIAKAQAKKLVERFSSCAFLERNGDVRIPREVWQQLRKEVG